MNNTTRYTLIFLAGMVIGGFGIALWLAPATTLPWSKTSTVSTSTSTDTGLAPDTSGRVAVQDQPAGTMVTVESITVSPPGVWVAIRELQGSVLGNVLGAARVRGPASNLTVSLLRSTLANHTYAVALYRDEGDGVFALATDSAYVDFDTGLPVVAPFKTK